MTPTRKALLIVALLSALPAFGNDPDIAITTYVRAKQIRFAERPQVTVVVSGNVNGVAAATVSKTERQNLPETVEPHVTYRDIGILLTITSTLPNIEQILDEVLGPQTQLQEEKNVSTP
jgi:hypothetical protein